MIDKEEILKLSKLARLAITQEEAGALEKEIDPVLAYVSKVKELSSLSADSGVGLVENVLRQDGQARAGGEMTEEFIKNAPASKGNFIEVKKVIDRG